MDKQKTTVRVAGREYTLVSSDSPEYIGRVAAYVDRKINEAALAAHQALYAAQFPPDQLARYIQLPLDPDNPLPDAGSWAGKTDLPGREEKGVSV